jgi:hypothetical protein
MSNVAQGPGSSSEDSISEAAQALAAEWDWIFHVVQPFRAVDEGFEKAQAVECSSRAQAISRAKQMSKVYGGAVAFIRPSSLGKYGPALLLGKFGNVPDDPLAKRWGWGPTEG